MHPSATVDTSLSPVDGFRTCTPRKNTSMALIKDMIIKERASGEPVISIQYSVAIVYECICQADMWPLSMF